MACSAWLHSRCHIPGFCQNPADISGQSNTVTVDGGDQLIGEQNTADGQAPVVTGSNKVESSTVTVSCLYTETSGEAWRKVRDRYIGTDKTIAVRYSPRGGAQAERRFGQPRDQKDETGDNTKAAA